ncbi:uncharacterized protein F5891DRAFT_1020827 [Suillus fuscotomentosus]|uniref:Uncharacterized protein n=1 Tax=Suillus fuscotomentosus TaxID=1912939 RepID=A0AAD4EBE0_9AGAM|nr:uncharacterized protein F5891DRAFT_1020827 [Suillus fuscotomentosus]KAG1903159.1 hypothetical protein F5891DRAFT_1020827 [Suillus fuscotomentosus]
MFYSSPTSNTIKSRIDNLSIQLNCVCHDAHLSLDPNCLLEAIHSTFRTISQSRRTIIITLSIVPFQNIYQGSQDIKACILSPHLRALSQIPSCLLRPMHFPFLTVLVALTTFMYVSATPSVFSRSCHAVGKYCQQGSDCCSDACAYTSDCSAKTCVDDDSILIGELARRESESRFCLHIDAVVHSTIHS